MSAQCMRRIRLAISTIGVVIAGGLFAIGYLPCLDCGGGGMSSGSSGCFAAQPDA